VRDALREQGTLAAREETIKVFDPLSWTDAQKQLTAHYEPGVQLRFVKNTTHYKAGETAEVVGHRGQHLLVRGSDGHKRSFLPSRAPSLFEVGEARELSLAAGDVLLLRANAPGFVNGERVTVKKIEGQKISLVDGRELPRDYRTFTHGYAVTSHAAQGKTVDQVFVVASSRSFAAVSQEQFYVSISRARERAQVFTDDAELLGRRVEDSHTRKAAIELDGLREELAKNGYQPTERKSERQRIAPTLDEGRAYREVLELRAERLSPMERVIQWVEDFRQQIEQRLGITQKETQQVAQRQAVSERMAIKQRPDTPRQSHGISI
jgi:hypothetical protein